MIGASSSNDKKRSRDLHSGGPELLDLIEDESLVSPSRSKIRKMQSQERPKNTIPFFSQDWVRELLAKGKTREDSPGVDFPPASQAQNGSSAKLPSVHRQPASPHSNNSSVSASASAPAPASSPSSDDLPLASSLRTSISAFRPDMPAPLLEAISKVEDSLKELKEVYRREVECVKIQLAQRELVIDQLRARLRTRPHKKDASRGQTSA